MAADEDAGAGLSNLAGGRMGLEPPARRGTIRGLRDVRGDPFRAPAFIQSCAAGPPQRTIEIRFVPRAISK